MFRKIASGFYLLLLLSKPVFLNAQDRIPPSQDNPVAVTRFFDQLRRIFGKFSQADLQQVFQAADPIRCPELVQGKGEWKPVAFFNDKRDLGAWYHQSLDEVKTDLRTYIFKGTCRDVRSTIQLTTKFPVAESIQSYNRREIRLQDIEVNVNAPVDAVYSVQFRSYSFNLPYMFLREHREGALLYTLTPQRISDRGNYEPDIIDHWDCKAVREEDVTYQFLICRSTLNTLASLRLGYRAVPFGASGYVILSDGKEGRANVRYSFGDTPDAPPDTGKPVPRPRP